MSTLNFKHAEIDISFEQLETLNFENFKNLAIENRIKQKNAYLLAENVENIETGISGYLLLLIQLYKNNQNPDLIQKISEITDELVTYCRNHATSNYSLYTGRTGVIYFLLQLYDVKKKHALLKVCVEMVQLSENEFLPSPYASDYLYDGRSGVLIVLLRLFQLTGAEKISMLINKYCIKIIENATWTEKGFSWGVLEELHIKNSCGFAHGAAGILYVLHKVNLCFPNDAIDYVIKETKKYVDDCRDNYKMEWFNFEKDIFRDEQLKNYISCYKEGDTSLFDATTNLSWNSGSAGISLAYEDTKIDWEKTEIISDHFPVNIYNGLAGIALSLQYNPSENVDLIRKIFKKLHMRPLLSLDGGLMFGQMGVDYLLLKCMTGDSNNITLPGNFPFKNLNFKLSLNTDELNKILLRKFYFKTITFIEVNAWEVLEKFLQNLKGDILQIDLQPFYQFISNPGSFKDSFINFEVVNDIYTYETEKANFNRRNNKSRLQLYLDTVIHREKILLMLNRPDEDLLNQEFRVSDAVRLVRSKWYWSKNEIFEYVSNVNKASFSFEYIFIHTHEYRNVLDFYVKLDALILNRFKNRNSIRSVVAEAKHYFKSQPEDLVKAFAEDTGSMNTEEFLERIDFLVSDTVRNFAYDGILEHVN